MDDRQQYTLTFENGSAADANRWASELKDYLLDVTPDVEVELRRETPYSQDLGTILSLVLGAPAVIAVTKALGNWLTLHRQAGITIKTSRGEIVATNLTSEDIMQLTKLMLAQKE